MDLIKTLRWPLIAFVCCQSCISTASIIRRVGKYTFISSRILCLRAGVMLFDGLEHLFFFIPFFHRDISSVNPLSKITSISGFYISEGGLKRFITYI